jgi:hypothetical protein
LAAVAVTGGAMAQAVMTGYVAFGYEADTTSAGALSSGMGLDDAEINFAVSEDIEGVGKLSGSMGFISGGRGAAASGRDTNIKITGASGASINFSNAMGASYLTQGVASVGTAAQWDLSGKLFSTRTINDAITIKLPVAEGTSISMAHSEGTVVSYWTGSGAAGDAVNSGQRYNTVSIDYAAGPLTVNGGYRSYDNTQSNITSSANTRNRASASYDLGAVKMGVGYEQTSYMYGNTKTDTLVGVNMPLSGALSIGAQLGSQSTSGQATAANNYNRSGTLLVANYNLSKQSYVVANYYSYDAGSTQNATGYGVFFYKGF